MIIGDSIAKGITVPGCSTKAKVGASSGYILENYGQGRDVTIISSGSNDPDNPELFYNLYRLRLRIKSNKVIWILPYNRKAAATVRTAALPGDIIVDLSKCPSKDKVHPSNYKCLNNLVGVL